MKGSSGLILELLIVFYRCDFVEGKKNFGGF